MSGEDCGGRVDERPHSPWWHEMDDEWDEGREGLIGNRERPEEIFSLVRNRELFVVVVVGGRNRGLGGGYD